MVSLPGGFRVPGHFMIRLRGRARRTPVDCQAAIEMIDGKPHMRALAFEVRDPQARPLSAADLAELNLVQVLDAAVRQEALHHTPMEWDWVQDDEAPADLRSFMGEAAARLEAHSGAALTAARSARDRRRITAEDLRQVRDIHAAKGIAGVMDELGYSERNAWRLLARARKELA
jgi:hypothetical protein